MLWLGSDQNTAPCLSVYVCVTTVHTASQHLAHHPSSREIHNRTTNRDEPATSLNQSTAQVWQCALQISSGLFHTLSVYFWGIKDAQCAEFAANSVLRNTITRSVNYKKDIL